MSIIYYTMSMIYYIIILKNRFKASENYDIIGYFSRGVVII